MIVAVRMAGLIVIYDSAMDGRRDCVMDMAVNMESVELGSTDNHLVFQGYVPSLNNFYRYRFDFIGTDLTSTSGMTDKQLKRLKEELNRDYGYAPYDEREAQRILGDGKQYRIRM